jgi:predicted O-methyltransferase YrrM
MKSDNPILTQQPWLSGEVINFIQDFLSKHPSPKILEFGTGCSTIFFATMTPSHLVAVEHSPIWFKSVQDYLGAHNLQVDLRLVTNKYYEECYKFEPDYFDLILLDGKDRMACLQVIRDSKILKIGGVVILDDADMRAKYQVADEMMAGWQTVEIGGLKQNPLHLDDAPVYGVAKCWFRSKV